MRQFLVFTGIITAFLTFAKPAHAGDIQVSNAVVQLPVLATARTAAASFTIENTGQAEDRLLEISTPNAEMASLHQTVEDNGVLKMVDIEGLEISPGKTIDLSSEHMHVMLMGLKARLEQGAAVPFKLKFEKAGDMDVQATVVRTITP